MTVRCVKSLILPLCNETMSETVQNMTKLTIVRLTVNRICPFGTKMVDFEQSWKVIIITDNINNNSKTMFMVLSSWQSHCESSPGSFDECRMAPSGRRPKTKPDDCESACTGCRSPHPPSPFIIITQTESWYSFYRAMADRRLSRPSWLVTYRYGLPVQRQSPILVLTGSGIAQVRWSRPTHYE